MTGRGRSTRVHRGVVTTEVDVEIDIEDVLWDIDDETLRKECAARGIVTAPETQSKAKAEDWRDFAEAMRGAVAAGDPLHVGVMIVRMLALAGVPRLTIAKARVDA